MRARRAHLPIAGRSLGTLVLSAAAARNMALTEGADTAARTSDIVWPRGADGGPSCAGLGDALSARAAAAALDLLAALSCGPVSFGAGLDGIGAPHSVQCHASQRPAHLCLVTLVFPSSKRQPDLTKARPQNGVCEAANGNNVAGFEMSGKQQRA